MANALPIVLIIAFIVALMYVARLLYIGLKVLPKTDKHNSSQKE